MKLFFTGVLDALNLLLLLNYSPWGKEHNEMLLYTQKICSLLPSVHTHENVQSRKYNCHFV